MRQPSLYHSPVSDRIRRGIARVRAAVARLLERRSAPAPEPTSRRYARGACPHCNQPSRVLRKDGEPHRGFYKCGMFEPTVSIASIEVLEAPAPDVPRFPMQDQDQ